jgi:pimeloyl-ACP methyl ester carboxylesterase
VEIRRLQPSIAPAVVEDLRARVRATRWLERPLRPGWSAGTDLAVLRRLAEYWADGFDWTRQERRLGTFDHHVATIDGIDLHFVHVRGVEAVGLPIVLGHGWPSSFLEYLPVAQRLADPPAWGIDAGARDVVIPSLPGYAFSPRPLDRPVTYRVVAEAWARLMPELGYDRYLAGGDDFGAGVATFAALQHPEAVAGLHLTHPEIRPPRDPDRPLTPEEGAFVEAMQQLGQDDGGFAHVQRTRPQTLAVALTDSPVGYAAWVLDRWHAWTDHRGEFESYLDRDVLLTGLTLQWAANSVGTAMLDYLDNAQQPPAIQPGVRVETPTAFALFRNYSPPIPVPPARWLARLYNLQRYTVSSRGGHFSPLERPDDVATDIIEFARTLE